MYKEALLFLLLHHIFLLFDELNFVPRYESFYPIFMVHNNFRIFNLIIKLFNYNYNIRKNKILVKLKLLK